MKRLVIAASFVGVSLVGYGQATVKVKPKPGEVSKEMQHKQEVAKDTSKPKPINSEVPIPANTVYVLNADQVQLLQYVVNMSQAPHTQVMQLIQILQTQQYHPPVPSTDSTANKK
jgi:hypothetical protein